MFTIPELRAYITNTVTQYYNLAELDNNRLDVITPTKDSEGNVEPLILYAKTNNNAVDDRYELTQDDLGPFAES